MFNLLIAYSSTAWETDQLMSMDRERFLEHTPAHLSEKFSSEEPATLKGLEGIPTILMYEPGHDGDNREVVRYGQLRDILLSGSKLTFRFDDQGRFHRSQVMEFADRLGFGRLEHGRTHWAVKDGDIPSALMDLLQNRYDLVFSFAGEDRDYVKKVAEKLTKSGVRIFYDEYDQAALWGKDLAIEFDLIYQHSSRYCVMFISQAYVKKMWTRHERRAALARALAESKEYILPARFDATPVPGLLPTIAHIDLAELSPAKFVSIILEKLGRK